MAMFFSLKEGYRVLPNTNLLLELAKSVVGLSQHMTTTLILSMMLEHPCYTEAQIKSYIRQGEAIRRKLTVSVNNSYGFA